MLCGVHLHQYRPNWEDRLLRLRVPIITVLTQDAGYYLAPTNPNRPANVPRLYQPGMIVILRKYHPDAMSNDPVVWANSVDHDVKEIAAGCGIPIRDIIAQGYNELALNAEHGGNGYGGQPWDSDAAWPVRRDWIMAYHRQIARWNPEYTDGVLWESPGHQDVDGRQEIQQFIDLGLFAGKNVAFGGHYYARGLTEAGNPQGDGGYDAPDKEWYSDRCLKARDILDANGLQHIKIWIGETNRKDIGQGDILGELDRWSGRIAHAVAGWTFFIWDSPDPSFATFRLGSVLTDDARLARFQGIIDKYLGVQPGPTPEPEPEPIPPTPPSGDIARIESKYNMSHRDSETVYLAELIERPDPPSIAAYGPSDLRVLVSTNDDQWQGSGMGYAEVAFSHPAAYYPTQGQKGFFYSECGGARVDGQGWAFGIPGDTAPHRNVVAYFARGAPQPPDPGPQPPSGHTWSGAFAGYAAAHPEVGQPVGPIAYLPQDTEPWPIAAQLGASHVLVWDGAAVQAIPRKA